MGLTRQEASERVRAEGAYLDKVIEKHQNESPQEEKNDTPRLDQESEGVVVLVLLADKTTRSMPVQLLFALSDTVKRMVASRLKYGVRYGIADDTSAGAAKASEKETTTQGTEGSTDNIGGPMELSLIEFDANAVRMQFMDLLTSTINKPLLPRQKKNSSLNLQLFLENDA